jgi:Carboxypeptidase regulatory-like domain
MKIFSKALLIWLCLVVFAAAADNSSSLAFTVLKDDNGKPVRNASVVLHRVDKDGHQSKAGVELKTDSEGKSSFDGAPYGKLRVQVLAPGFQTFGSDYEINQPQQEIVIKLKRPSGQYTIYK